MLAAAPWTSGWGEVAVVEKVVGYKKIKFYTHENAGYGDVRLPEMQMHTTAFWLTVPEAACARVAAGRAAAIDGLRGVGMALETVATLALMCDPRDLGTTLGDAAPDDGTSGRAPAVPRKVRGGPRPGYSPTLFVYEHVPGGTGLAERIWEQRDELARARAAADRELPVRAGLPGMRGAGRGVTQGDGHRAAARRRCLRPDRSRRFSSPACGGFAVRTRSAAPRRAPRPRGALREDLGNGKPKSSQPLGVTQTGPTSR